MSASCARNCETTPAIPATSSPSAGAGTGSSPTWGRRRQPARWRRRVVQRREREGYSRMRTSRVLTVEDDTALASVIRLSLRGLGFESLAASDGYEALRVACRDH